MTSFTAQLRKYQERLLASPCVGLYERPAIIVSLGMTGVVATGLSDNVVQYKSDLDPVLVFLAMIWVCGHVACVAGLRSIEQMLKSTSVLLYLAVVAALANAVLATCRHPYADDALAAADTALTGRQCWPSIVSMIRCHVDLMHALSWAYTTLNWQPLLFIACSCLSGGGQRAWRFVLAWALALSGCLAVFIWMPGQGAYVHFGISPESVPAVQVLSAWQYPKVLESIRSGAITTLSSETLEGMVTMPSFHACAAVILAWGFAGLRWIRWPFVALNAAMWVSAVPIGGHYLIDVLAGSALAVIAVVASGPFCDGSRVQG